MKESKGKALTVGKKNKIRIRASGDFKKVSAALSVGTLILNEQKCVCYFVKKQLKYEY